MAGMVRTGDPSAETRLIDLYVTHPDPVMAQRLAEAVGREYNPQFNRAGAPRSVRRRLRLFA